MSNRDDITGLRAICVLSVLLAHAQIPGFAGGFIGVDIFFVISGFVITASISAQGDENFSYLRFWGNRIRRLLPALIFVVLVTVPFAYLWMLPDPLENFGQSIVASLLFANNLLLYLTSGYWDLAADYKPFLHTWSLGVEAQFYFLFPFFLLIICPRTPRNRCNALLLSVILLFLIDLIQRYIFSWDTFYFPHARGWQLLSGALAFYLTKAWNMKTNMGLTTLGLILIIISILVISPLDPTPGPVVTPAVLGSMLFLIFSADHFPTSKLLRSWFVQKIGLASYSIYLIHQPLFAFSRIFSKQRPDIAINFLIMCASIFFGMLIYIFIEKKFRSVNYLSNQKFVALLFFFVASLIAFGLTSHYTGGLPSRLFSDPSQSQLSNINYNHRHKILEGKDFSSDKTKTKVLVIGNSFARDVINVILEEYNVSSLDIAYREFWRDCDIKKDIPTYKTFYEADIIVFGSNYSLNNSLCFENLLKENNNKDNSIFFIGTKHFGENLNWVTRLPVGQRNNLRNQLLVKYREIDFRAKELIPRENFISILDSLSNPNGILITDSNGDLVSWDRTHLTQAGAKLIGEKVFRNSSLNDILPRKNVNGN